MKRLLFLLLLGMLTARAAGATTSWYHIPASAFRAALTIPGCSPGNCEACTSNPIGLDMKQTWTCAATAMSDFGIETDVFSLPVFATSTSLLVRVIFRETSAVPDQIVAFYGWFEVTPISVPGADWSLNTGQDCARSAAGQSSLLTHEGWDQQVIVSIATCNQATLATCASVAACTGAPSGTGYHGVLTIRRDNSTVSPNLPSPVDITEVIVGVQTP